MARLSVRMRDDPDTEDEHDDTEDVHDKKPWMHFHPFSESATPFLIPHPTQAPSWNPAPDITEESDTNLIPDITNESGSDPIEQIEEYSTEEYQHSTEEYQHSTEEYQHSTKEYQHSTKEYQHSTLQTKTSKPYQPAGSANIALPTSSDTISSYSSPEPTTTDSADVYGGVYGTGNPEPGGKEGLPLNAKLAIGFGALVLVLAGILFAGYWLRNRKIKKRPKAEVVNNPRPRARFTSPPTEKHPSPPFTRHKSDVNGAYHTDIDKPDVASMQSRNPFANIMSMPSRKRQGNPFADTYLSGIDTSDLVSMRSHNSGQEDTFANIVSMPRRSRQENPFADTYLTGIDTSDAVSMRSHSGQEGTSLDEAPPPPYRPRSNTALRTTPTSDNSNVHASPAVHSQTNLLANPNQNLESPFNDIDSDDAVSDMSGPVLHRSWDELSVVSDVSYQQDPVVPRESA